MSDNLSINFPKRHYVGRRDDGGVITGFLIPHGTDKAYAKRKDSVDSWAKKINKYDFVLNTTTRQYDSIPNGRVPLDPLEFDNTPIKGFTLIDRLNRGGSWYGNQDKWKVNDPRGFQLEISGSNLLKIIEYCTITSGLIDAECVWARDGANNVLVPVNSELYKNAMVNTERRSKTVSVKNLKPGDIVVFKNGDKKEYIGFYYVMAPEYQGTNNVIPKKEISKNKKHVFRQTVNDSVWYSASTSPTIAEIVETGNVPRTMAEVNHELSKDRFSSLDEIFDAPHEIKYSLVNSQHGKVFGHGSDFVYESNYYRYVFDANLKIIDQRYMGNFIDRFNPLSKLNVAQTNRYDILCQIFDKDGNVIKEETIKFNF